MPDGKMVTVFKDMHKIGAHLISFAITNKPASHKHTVEPGQAGGKWQRVLQIKGGGWEMTTST